MNISRSLAAPAHELRLQGSDLEPAMRNLGTGCIFAGAVTVLIGLLDHRQLVVGMPRPPQTAEDAEDTEATAEAAR